MDNRKDRFDLLLSRAAAGNARACYRLARWLAKGHLVEKNIEAARYWAFKALSLNHPRAGALFDKIRPGQRP